MLQYLILYLSLVSSLHDLATSHCHSIHHNNDWWLQVIAWHLLRPDMLQVQNILWYRDVRLDVFKEQLIEIHVRIVNRQFYKRVKVTSSQIWMGRRTWSRKPKNDWRIKKTVFDSVRIYFIWLILVEEVLVF